MLKMGKQRIISLLLAICLVLGLVPVWNVEVQAASYPAAFPTPELTGDQAADVVAVAESQVGYKTTSPDETVYAAEIGATNPNYWCAYFVKWCMNKAGVTDYLSVSGGAGSSTLLMRYFEKNGTWHGNFNQSWTNIHGSGTNTKDGSYTPQPGDVVIIETSNDLSDGPDHTGLVVWVSEDGSRIETVEGNTTNDEVKRKSYSRWSSYIWGFGRPNYNDVFAPTSATISVEKEEVSIAETFVLNCASDQPCSYYISIFDADSGEHITSGYSKRKYENAFNKAGHYTAYMSAYNRKGSVDSNWVDFYVYGPAPTEATITCSSQAIPLGGTETFSLTSNTYYARYWVSIYDAEGNQLESNWKTDGFTYTPDKPGTYWFYTSAHTVSGGVDSKWRSFVVYSDIGDELNVTIHNAQSGYPIRNNAGNVEMTENNNDNSNCWKILKNTDGSYRIISVLDGMALSAESEDDVNGVNIETRVYEESASQKWWIFQNSNGLLLRPQSSSRVMSMEGENSDTGSSVRLWEQNGSAQFWVLKTASIHTHTLVKHAKKDATCTEKGYEAYWECNDCKKLFSDENGTQEITAVVEIPLAAHATVLKNKKTATCTETGYTGDYVCTGCGQTITKGQSIAKTGHNYDSGKVTTKATCEKDGVKTYTCANCGGSKTETIKATGHSWGSGKVTTKATCEKDGVKTYTCANCGDTKTETIKATGHNWDSGKVTTKATCEKNGVKTYTCANCGGTKTETIKATGHSYESEVAKATCTEKGYTLHTCKNCGDSYKDTYTGAIGHSWDSGKVTTKGTCEKNGVKTYTCKNCNKTKTETIPATGHNYETKVVKPTCTEKGYTLHTCKNCGDSYKDTYTSATGHEWDSGKVTTKATCEKNGVKTYTCANCGGTKTETIKATGHSWGSGKVTTKATCEKDGVKTYTCANCGGTKTETIKATGHSYESKVVKPTCTEKGYTLHTCKNCSDSYKDTYVDATGHSWDKETVTKAPTGSETGVKTYTCKTCGETKTEEIAKLSNPFTDLKNPSSYYDAVLWAVDKGITKGTSATEFSPKADCTRAQIVTFLWRYAGSPEPKSMNHNFVDIVEGSSYYKAVIWAVEKGITTGTDATHFSPKEPCTRAQIVTFLWRYAGKPQPSSQSHNFTDIVKGSSYYDAVLWAVEKGITTGADTTHFSPKDPCTRAQGMTFLYRYNNTK